MFWDKLLAFAVLLILVSGCTLPGEPIGEHDLQGTESKPPIREVHKSVAIVDGSVQEPQEGTAANKTGTGGENESVSVEGGENESVSVEEGGEENETSVKLVEFQPPALLLSCNGDCTRHRVYDGENGVVIAAINQSRILMAKEKGHFLIYSHGCAESNGVNDSFEADGEEYWFDYPAAFKRDWADYAEFQGNESGFSLHEGENRNFNQERVFLWKIVPGASTCDAWVEISILGETVFLEEWMDGVVLGLEEKDGELELQYLMYPENTLN
jgi:hypothetical protein